GFDTIRKNVGAKEHRGLEFQHTKTILEKPNIRWTSSLNLSLNSNKVLDMRTNADIVVNTWGADAFILKAVQHIGSYYMYQTDGLLLPHHFDNDGNALLPIANGQQQGNIRIVNQDHNNIINTDDYVILGSNQPVFLYGFSNEITY